MVVIRLARGGAKKRPFYNIVVADSRSRATAASSSASASTTRRRPAGRESLRIDGERLAHWTGKGAQLSPTRRAARQVACQARNRRESAARVTWS